MDHLIDRRRDHSRTHEAATTTRPNFVDLIRHPAIHVRLRPGHRIKSSEDGDSFALESFGATRHLGRSNQHFAAAFASLHDGAPLGLLRDQVLEASGTYEAAAFLLWLQRLTRLGIIDYPLVDDGQRLAIVIPQRTGVLPLPAADAWERPSRALSRFAFLRPYGAEWLLEHPLVGARIAFAHASTAAAIVEPCDESSKSEGFRLVLAVLAGLGFLDDGAGNRVAPDNAARIETLQQWEFHDLAFHFHSRRGWHLDPAGGLFPHVGEIVPPPAVRPAWEGARIPLDRVDAGTPSAPLVEVMERRRSHRRYETAPSLHDLGVFLDRVARVRHTWTVPVTGINGRLTEMELSRRVYPNGGASYELEIYPVIDRCDGLEPGLYHYDAGSHVLVRLSGRTAETDRMLRDAKLATAGLATPQILFAITARFSRVMWKYKSIAYAVILRNAGVLYQTMYLTATDMGLSPCGLGSGDSALFAAATGLDPVIENTVGEFLLGGRPLE